jgi:NADH dehydrogenase (ubiquinone) 1 alpha subcomplex subunit 9
VVSADAVTLEDLGVEQVSMERVAINWLRRFRKPSQHDSLLDLQ